MLHAHYQQARDGRLAAAVQEGVRPPSLENLYFPAAPLPGRPPFGQMISPFGKPVWFSYLGDLLELVKVLE
jgi:hypothetical protein